MYGREGGGEGGMRDESYRWQLRFCSCTCVTYLERELTPLCVDSA